MQLLHPLGGVRLSNEEADEGPAATWPPPGILRWVVNVRSKTVACGYVLLTCSDALGPLMQD